MTEPEARKPKRRRAAHLDATVCYLCGEPLSEPTNRDHVPPDQIFAKPLRGKHQLRLETIPVHASCNTAYKLDEEYFVHNLIPFAPGSEAGDAIYQKTIRDFHAGQKLTVSLVNHVLSSVEERPSGLLLPNGRVAVRLDGDRFWRIVWKIVRGLHFIETQDVLPVEWLVTYSITVPNETPPDHFELFMRFSRESFGNHQGVFAYRRETILTPEPVIYWALLFWDKVILTAHFHPPTCKCEECSAQRAENLASRRYGGTA